MITVACVCDTHGAVPPPLDQSSKGQVAAWLHAGDIYDRGDRSRQKAPTTKALEVRDWIKGKKVPVFSVAGNHDCNENASIFAVSHNATGDCLRVPDSRIWVAGIGWSGERFYDLPRERDVAEVCVKTMNEIVRRSQAGDKFIVLTHYMPWFPRAFSFSGNREGWAFDCIAELVREVKPLAVVFGHIHELFGRQVPYAEHALTDKGDLNTLKTLLVCPGPKGGHLHIDIDAGQAFFDPAP